MAINHINESLTGVSQTSAIKGRTADVSVSGTFSGTVEVQRLFDGTTGWQTATDTAGADLTFTTPFELVASSAGRCRWRVACTAYTSGTIVASLRRGDDSVSG